MSDPYYSNVVLLLNFQGADTSTTFTDESNAPKTVTAQGNAQIDTSDGDFPGGCMQLDGTGDKAWADVNSSVDTSLLWGTGDFTLESSIKTTDSDFMVFDYWASGNASSWFLYVNASGYLEWRVVDSGGTTQLLLGATSNAVNTGARVHVGVSRVSGTLYLVAGGSVVASVADTTDYVYATAATLSIGGYAGATTYDMDGRIGPTRATKGVGRYSGTYTPPTGLFELGHEAVTAHLSVATMLSPALRGHMLYGRASAASMLGAPALRGHMLYGRASAPSMLGAAAVLAWHDFTGQVDPAAPTRYVMDLVTPGGLVRVPISSWQATLQTDEANYAQCVIPACTDWVVDITAATEFVVSRVATLTDGSTLEYEMVRCPVEQVAISGGSRNRTAVLSGYTDALLGDVDPPVAYDRVLTGVRTVTRNNGLTRVRCDMDWLLRPGHRAYLDDEPIIVRFINHYMPGSDQYMDIGDRV